MINRHSDLSLLKQCQVLDIPRSGIYHKPKPVKDIDLILMRLIDEIHLDKPFLGIRRIRDALHDLYHFQKLIILMLSNLYCTIYG